ncbi:38053_t:CDS:2, partial [Gigaspora margarita]
QQVEVEITIIVRKHRRILEEMEDLMQALEQDVTSMDQNMAKWLSLSNHIAKILQQNVDEDKIVRKREKNTDINKTVLIETECGVSDYGTEESLKVCANLSQKEVDVDIRKTSEDCMFAKEKENTMLDEAMRKNSYACNDSIIHRHEMQKKKFNITKVIDSDKHSTLNLKGKEKEHILEKDDENSLKCKGHNKQRTNKGNCYTERRWKHKYDDFEEFGFVNSFRQLNPLTRKFTWSNSSTHTRIDHIMVSSSLQKKLLNAGIDEMETMTGSDHNLVIVEFKVALENFGEEERLWKYLQSKLPSCFLEQCRNLESGDITVFENQIDTIWDIIEKAILDTAEKTLLSKVIKTSSKEHSS